MKMGRGDLFTWTVNTGTVNTGTVNIGTVNTGTAGVSPALSAANNAFAARFLAVSRRVVVEGCEVPMLGALANGLFATLSAGGTPAVPGFAVPVKAKAVV